MIVTLSHREQFQHLRIGYQLHAFMAGKKAMDYSDYFKPWVKNFEPPKQRKRTEDAPYSIEFIECFERAMDYGLVSSSCIANFGLPQLRNSGLDI